MKPNPNSEHIFHVQVGQWKKGAYHTRYSFDSVGRAMMWYSSINIGRGYKKRLITRTGKVLVKASSALK